MNNQNLKSNLLKSFIHSEFFIQQKKFRNLELDNQTSQLYTFKNQSLVTLNPFIQFKLVKQFLRLLQITKKSNLPFLYILVKNSQFNFLIYEFTKQNKHLFPIDVELDSDLLKDTNISKLILLLNCFFYEKSTVFTKSNKNYNLLVKVNSLNEFLYPNHYKILNDIETHKKLIFILTIIKKIFIYKKI
jgi:hypothetical protein